jgi:hypothetical protein
MFLALVTTGCGTAVQYAPTNTPPVPVQARPPSQVEVFTTQPPKRAYVEVGILEAQQQSEYSMDTRLDVLAKLRQVAGARGCHAILLNGSSDKVVGRSQMSVFKGTGSGSGFVTTLEGYRATCLVYTDDGKSAASPGRTATATIVVAPAAPPPAAPAVTTARCVPGESRACVGPGGCAGGQACSANGDRYEPCDCGPARPPSAAGNTAGSAPSSPTAQTSAPTAQ